MIRQAAGDFVLPAQADLVAQGHAIEARLYAEDPARDFGPSAGLLTEVSFPPDARVDGWIETGTIVTPFYDPLLAKLVVHAASRDAALIELQRVLAASAVWGIETNLAYLAALTADPEFRGGTMKTATPPRPRYEPPTLTVLAAGAPSSLQEWPGPVGDLHCGGPPGGALGEPAHPPVHPIARNTPGAGAREV